MKAETASEYPVMSTFHPIDAARASVSVIRALAGMGHAPRRPRHLARADARFLYRDLSSITRGSGSAPSMPAMSGRPYQQGRPV